MSDTTTLTLEEAGDLARRALRAANVSEANAATVAAALVAAERDGQGGHGLARVPAYAAQARAGKVDGHATPTLDRIAPAMLRVDAAHGFAFPAIELAVERLPSVARGAGLAGAAIARSHHAGVLAHPVERLAREGLVAIMVANAPKAMAPWGGAAPLYGTNPIAFAAPVGAPDGKASDGKGPDGKGLDGKGPDGAGPEPLVVDLSLSRVARGKVMRAAQRGEPIPEGWALDADGNPTTDAEAALAGTMVPAGEAKGAALALMVEVLAASLTGASHSADASSFFDAEGPPPGTGQFLLVIDPRAAAPGFVERTAALLDMIVAQGARVPGTSRLAARARAEREGVRVETGLVDAIRALGEADGGSDGDRDAPSEDGDVPGEDGEVSSEGGDASGEAADASGEGADA